MVRDDEKGYIVVETIGCFILFVFLNMSILSLINIVAVQARVHYALTQTAETLSMYSYTFEAMGLAEHFTKSEERSGNVKKNAAELVDNINGLIDAVESMNWSELQSSSGNTYNQVSGFAQSVLDDPKSVLQDFMNLGLSSAKNYAFGELARPLMKHYLTNGAMDGDEYLRRFHVENGGKKGIDAIEFYSVDLISVDGDKDRLTYGGNNDSAFLDSSGNIKLVAQYDIDYTFGALPLPFGKLHITQEVVTKAWLNGNGEGYVEE